MGWNETIQGMLAKEPPMTDLTSLDLETTAESRLGVFAECSLADAILRDFDKLVDFIDRLRDDKQPMADNSGEITAAEDVLTWLLIEKLTCSDDRSYTPHEAQKIVATALDERDTLKARVAELEAGLHSPDHARNRIRPSPPLRKAPDMSEARGGDPDPVPAPMPHHAGWWTHDAEAAKDVGHLYYFAPVNRAPRPYTTQRHVQAIIDVASDGTLAGVELIDAMPPPPAAPVPFPLPDWGKVKEALKTSRPRINCIIAAIETGNAEAAMIWLRSLSEDHDAALATLEQTDG